jgi:hypothetical protein
LASNEKDSVQKLCTLFFGLKKIACEWVGNHGFDHFWSENSQNFLNFMEHIYDRLEQKMFVCIKRNFLLCFISKLRQKAKIGSTHFSIREFFDQAK